VICDSQQQLTQKWKDDVISLDPTGQPVINVTTWLSRTTLDIIGEGECSASVKTVFYMILCVAGFDFHFGSLDNEMTPLARQYENLL
jgi:hypothetical protein